ncbi:MAG: peptidase M4 [marine bacterium B5-7]|nr:MAG: peptidase M4 [marine bacterium B5-7]
MSLLLVMVVGTTSPLTLADDRDDEADKVIQWVAEGRILSLEQLLDMHSDRLRGRLLDLELEREHGRIIYEIEMIDEQGLIRKFELDAATGELLQEEIND